VNQPAREEGGFRRGKCAGAGNALNGVKGQGGAAGFLGLVVRAMRAGAAEVETVASGPQNVVRQCRNPILMRQRSASIESLRPGHLMLRDEDSPDLFKGPGGGLLWNGSGRTR